MEGGARLVLALPREDSDNLACMVLEDNDDLEALDKDESGGTSDEGTTVDYSPSRMRQEDEVCVSRG